MDLLLSYDLHVINGKATKIKSPLGNSGMLPYGKNALESPLVTPVNSPNKLYPYWYWGGNNLMPTILNDAAKKCGLVRRCVDFLTQITLGTGIELVDRDPSTGEIIPLKDAMKYYALFHQLGGDRWFRRSTKDYWMFGNTFSKILMNREKIRKPALLVHEDASYCRWARQDDNSLMVEWCYISGQWKYRRMFEGDEFLGRVKALDPNLYQDQLTELNEDVYMIGADIYTSGEFYYSELPWHSMDVMKNIAFLAKLPDIEESIWLKSIAMKYHIEISEDYLASKFGCNSATDPDYKKYNRDDRMAKLREVHDMIDENLTGPEHQHTSFISVFRYGQDGKERHGVIITPLDDKLKKDAHIPNSQNATGKVLEAFGLNPALTGSTMGNALSQGGGSDIRESWNVSVGSIYSDQQAILHPMKVCLQQYGMPSTAFIRVKNIVQETLDKSKSGTKSAYSNPQTENA